MPKNELRDRLKKRRATVKKENRLQWDNLIKKHLQEWDKYQKVERIMVYLSFNWEINTGPIVEDLWQAGKEVFVPVVDKPTGALIPTAYARETTMTAADFGILEPVGSATIDPSSLDLVLVPGLAFTKEGYRIGYGGGYYDRFLKTTQALRVGLCYSEFLVPKLPLDTWDKPVHFIATEKGVFRNKGVD